MHFIGSVDGAEIAYVGVSGMSLPSPEIQITVKEGYRGQGYGKEMLREVLDWLFKNTTERNIEMIVQTYPEWKIMLFSTIANG